MIQLIYRSKGAKAQRFEKQAFSLRLSDFASNLISGPRQFGGAHE